MQLFLNEIDIPIRPGTPTDVDVIVWNSGEAPQAYVVRPVGLEEAWSAPPQRTPVVMGGDRHILRFTVTLPVGYPAGSHAIEFVGHPVGGTDESRVDCLLTVGDISKIVVQLEPQQVRDNGRFKVRLRNRSDEDATLDLSGTSAGDRLRFKFKEPTVFLRADGERLVKGRARVDRKLFGSPRRYGFTVTAQGNSRPAHVSGSLQRAAVFRRGVLRIIGVIVIFAVWGTGLYFGLDQLRDFISRDNGSPASIEGENGSTDPDQEADESASPDATEGIGEDAEPPDGDAAPDADGPGAGRVRTSVGGVVTSQDPGGVNVSLRPVRPETQDTRPETSGGGSIQALSGLRAKILGRRHAPFASLSQHDQTITSSDGFWVVADVEGPAFYEVRFAKAGLDTRSFVIEISSDGKPVRLDVELAAASGALRGTVVDDQGAPLGGAQVTASEGPIRVATTTLDDGTWQLEQLSTPATYVVSAALAGYGTAFAHVSLEPNGSDDVPMILREGLGTIYGAAMYRPRSNPDVPEALSGVTVTVTGADGTVRSTTSVQDDDDVDRLTPRTGNFALEGLPIGQDYAVAFSAQGHLRQVQNVRLDGDDLEVSAVLARSTGGLQGTISVASGGPAVAAGVVATDGTHVYKTLTDGSGGYRIDGMVPGQYTVEFTKFGFHPAVQIVDIAASISDVTLSLTLAVDADARIFKADATVSGRAFLAELPEQGIPDLVLLVNGKPTTVDGSPVGPLPAVKTSADGTFKFAIQPGAHELSVETGGIYADVRVPFSVAETGVVTVDLPMRVLGALEGTITGLGTLSDPDAKVFLRSTVCLFRSVGNPSAGTQYLDGSARTDDGRYKTCKVVGDALGGTLVAEVVSGEGGQGRFEFESLLPGTYELVVLDQDVNGRPLTYHPHVQSLTIANDQRDERDVELRLFPFVDIRPVEPITAAPDGSPQFGPLTGAWISQPDPVGDRLLGKVVADELHFVEESTDASRVTLDPSSNRFQVVAFSGGDANAVVPFSFSVHHGDEDPDLRDRHTTQTVGVAGGTTPIFQVPLVAHGDIVIDLGYGYATNGVIETRWLPSWVPWSLHIERSGVQRLDVGDPPVGVLGTIDETLRSLIETPLNPSQLLFTADDTELDDGEDAARPIAGDYELQARAGTDRTVAVVGTSSSSGIDPEPPSRYGELTDQTQRAALLAVRAELANDYQGLGIDAPIASVTFPSEFFVLIDQWLQVAGDAARLAAALVDLGEEAGPDPNDSDVPKRTLLELGVPAITTTFTTELQDLLVVLDDLRLRRDRPFIEDLIALGVGGDANALEALVAQHQGRSSTLPFRAFSSSLLLDTLGLPTGADAYVFDPTDDPPTPTLCLTPQASPIVRLEVAPTLTAPGVTPDPVPIAASATLTDYLGRTMSPEGTHHDGPADGAPTDCGLALPSAAPEDATFVECVAASPGIVPGEVDGPQGPVANACLAGAPFRNLLPGTYTLTISAENHLDAIWDIDVQPYGIRATPVSADANPPGLADYRLDAVVGPALFRKASINVQVENARSGNRTTTVSVHALGESDLCVEDLLDNGPPPVASMQVAFADDQATTGTAAFDGFDTTDEGDRYCVIAERPFGPQRDVDLSTVIIADEPAMIDGPPVDAVLVAQVDLLLENRVSLDFSAFSVRDQFGQAVREPLVNADVVFAKVVPAPGERCTADPDNKASVEQVLDPNDEPTGVYTILDLAFDDPDNVIVCVEADGHATVTKTAQAIFDDQDRAPDQAEPADPGGAVFWVPATKRTVSVSVLDQDGVALQRSASQGATATLQLPTWVTIQDGPVVPAPDPACVDGSAATPDVVGNTIPAGVSGVGEALVFTFLEVAPTIWFLAAAIDGYRPIQTYIVVPPGAESPEVEALLLASCQFRLVPEVHIDITATFGHDGGDVVVSLGGSTTVKVSRFDEELTETATCDAGVTRASFFLDPGQWTVVVERAGFTAPAALIDVPAAIPYANPAPPFETVDLRPNLIDVDVDVKSNTLPLTIGTQASITARPSTTVAAVNGCTALGLGQYPEGLTFDVNTTNDPAVGQVQLPTTKQNESASFGFTVTGPGLLTETFTHIVRDDDRISLTVRNRLEAVTDPVTDFTVPPQLTLTLVNGPPTVFVFGLNDPPTTASRTTDSTSKTPETATFTATGFGGPRYAFDANNDYADLLFDTGGVFTFHKKVTAVVAFPEGTVGDASFTPVDPVYQADCSTTGPVTALEATILLCAGLDYTVTTTTPAATYALAGAGAGRFVCAVDTCTPELALATVTFPDGTTGDAEFDPVDATAPALCTVSDAIDPAFETTVMLCDGIDYTVTADASTYSLSSARATTYHCAGGTCIPTVAIVATFAESPTSVTFEPDPNNAPTGCTPVATVDGMTASARLCEGLDYDVTTTVDADPAPLIETYTLLSAAEGTYTCLVGTCTQP